MAESSEDTESMMKLSNLRYRVKATKGNGNADGGATSAKKAGPCGAPNQARASH